MQKRRILILCLAGLALAGCSEFARLVNSEDTAAPYELGKRYFDDTNYALAVEHFQLAASAEPGSVSALNGLGASYDQMGRFDLAERYYKQALSIAPDSTQTLNNLGVSYLMQDRPDLAVVYLVEARARDDADPAIETNHAVAVVALEALPVAGQAEHNTVAVAEKPIRRMTAAVQRLFTRTPAIVPVPRPRPLLEHQLASAAGLSIELSMLEPPEMTPDAVRSVPAGGGVKGAESPKPYSSLTIEIRESVEAS